MSKKLFIGGLAYSITDQALNDYFAKAGKIVSATVIVDRFTGKSKGFGFVEYETEEEAKKAMETLNNSEFEGRPIVVKEARPLEPRPAGSFNRGGGNRDFRGGGSRGGDRRGGPRSY